MNFVDDFIPDAPRQESRLKILAKCPSIEQFLSLPDPSYKYVLLATALSHFLTACLVSYVQSWTLVLVESILVGWVFGVCSWYGIHAVMHDVHTSVAEKKILCYLINIPMFIAIFAIYYVKHRTHHGHHMKTVTFRQVIDCEQERLSKTEGIVLKRLPFPIPYVYVGPLYGQQVPNTNARKLTASPMLVEQFVFQLVVDVLIVVVIGKFGVVYLLTSFALTKLVLNLHLGAYHPVKKGGSSEIRSRYGWLRNATTHNSGYHREHHDFPEIQQRYLPLVKRIASEFYP